MGKGGEVKAKGEEMQSTNLHKSTQKFVEISEDLWRTEKGLGVSSQELGLAATTFAKATVVKKDTKSAKPWPMVRLGDVCVFRRGLTYAKTDEVAYSSKVVLRSNNVDLETGVLNLNDLKYLREDFEIPSEKIIKPNTLLMCMANGSKSHLGKVALIEQDFEYAFGGFMGLLLPKDITPKYLYYFLKAPMFKAYVKSLQDGANINNLKFSDFSELQIPLPPLSVQKEIVERLEKELGEADKVAAEFKRMVELADTEFKAELDEVFNSLSANSAPPREIKNDGCVGFVTRGAAEDAEKWAMARLGDVCEEIRERISVDEVALKNYITTDNMLKGCGGVRVAESVPVEGSLVKYQIGDVLISNIRPYLKKAWLADRSGGCSSDVIVFRSVRTDLSEEYLFKALSQEGFFEYSMLNVSGTKMPRGKREWIKDFEFPLPPLSVQKEIVAKLDAAKERCEKLKAEAERGLRAAENLRKAILSEAFELN